MDILAIRGPLQKNGYGIMGNLAITYVYSVLKHRIFRIYKLGIKPKDADMDFSKYNLTQRADMDVISTNLGLRNGLSPNRRI